MNVRNIAAAMLAALGSTLASAQAQAPSSGVVIYGILDEYAGYIDAEGGARTKTLDAGGLSATRLGFRGSEDLGDGLRANFTLEHGFGVDTGAPSDASRFFNRQSYVGLSGRLGEVRLGRQNTPQFFMCGSFDALGCATYGSILNNTTSYTPRFDNTLHYIAPEFAGVKLQLGGALGEQPNAGRSLSAYMLSAEYKNGPFYIGANHTTQYSANVAVRARATFLGGNYDFGPGKVYVGLFKGDTPGASMSTNVLGRDTRVWSISADYRVMPLLLIGVLYGQANDITAAQKDASQVSLIGRYDLSKRTLFYAVATKLSNRNSANFSLGAAGPINRNVPIAGGDVTGAQVGIRHLF